MSISLVGILRSLTTVALKTLPTTTCKRVVATVFGHLFRVLPTSLLRQVLVDPVLSRGMSETVRGVFVSGAAVTIPFFVTAAVLGFVVNFVTNVLDPFVGFLMALGVTTPRSQPLAQLLTLVSLVVVVFLAGVASESATTSRFEGNVSRMVEEIPGVGSVYSSFDRMSEVLLDSESESFKEVKLLEFPHDDVYSLAFQTAEMPDGLAHESEMRVLFVPLAPNPVMGGFMVCVPEDRVHEIDMSVQEAFQALVTSGVAMPEKSG
jgi:uncharacterized membrane protein